MKSAEEIMACRPMYDKIGQTGFMSEKPGYSTWSISCSKCAGCQTIFSKVTREESTLLPDVFTKCPVCGCAPEPGVYVCRCGRRMNGCSLPSGHLIITALELQDFIDTSEDII